LEELEKAAELVTEEERDSESSEVSETTDSDDDDDNDDGDDSSNCESDVKEENEVRKKHDRTSLGLKKNKERRKISDIEELEDEEKEGEGGREEGERDEEEQQYKNKGEITVNSNTSSTTNSKLIENCTKQKENANIISSQTDKNEDENLEQRIASLTLSNDSSKTNMNSNFLQQHKKDVELDLGFGNSSLMSELTSVGKKGDRLSETKTGSKLNANKEEDDDDDDESNIGIETLKLPWDVTSNEKTSATKKIVIINSI